MSLSIGHSVSRSKQCGAVALALPLDVHKICETGLIDKDWQERAPNKSVVCESHVAIVTRKGNPKNVKGWDDLTRYVLYNNKANQINLIK